MQLNYNHLHYFWAVATQGSILAAAEALNVTPQTISGQLKTLAQQIGAPLFRKSGRSLVLSETGEVVFSYVKPMFELSAELDDVLRHGVARRSVQFKVGIAMVVPKLIAYRVLAPALELDEPVQIMCHEAPLEDLLADIAVHKLDLVLTDTPMSQIQRVRAYNHLLGESGLTFFSATRHAVRYRRGFPGSLDGEPFLFPTTSSALRGGLENWFRQRHLSPRNVAEFEDTALMNAFGEAGAGVFCLPTVIENDVRKRYRVTSIGRTTKLKERYYVISTERRLKHPSVVAITDLARERLFGVPGPRDKRNRRP